MLDFWQNLKRPFFALAPMEDVTDAAFRRIIASKGVPDVTYCEFTSADGLVLANESGQKKLRRKLLFSDRERPVVAQFFSSVPEHMEKAAAIAQELGFDGVDINMGCPDTSVEKTGCGSAMIKNPPLAREIIRTAKKGFKGPVSVKTRLGYNTDQLETWLPELLSEEPAAIALHARTRKEMSLVPARWERIKRAVEIRDSLRSSTLIIGNGDAKDISDASEKALASGADGVMLGRAIFGNPWLFSKRVDEVLPIEKISTLADHIKLFDELLGDVKSFAVMKKHFKAYINGWDGARELRNKLMASLAAGDALITLENSIADLSS